MAFPARVLMLATDRRLDRRILFAAGTLAAAGARACVVARALPPGEPESRLPPGVTLRRFATPGAHPFPGRRILVAAYRALAARLPGDLGFAPWTAALVAACRGMPADAIHAHDLDALPAGAALARARRIPLVYDAHEFLADSVAARAGDAALAERLIRAERGLAALADARVTVTAPLSTYMESRLGRGLAFAAVENAPPEPAARDEAEGRRLFLERLGPPRPGVARFVDPGSVERLRNPFVLVEAALLAGPAVELHLPRLGPEAEALERFARVRGATNVRLFPFVPPERWRGFLSGFDGAVVTIRGIDRYFERTGPNRFYDALDAGLPLLADPTLLCAREAVAAGAARAADMRDPAALAAALRALPRGEAAAAMREAACALSARIRDRARSALLGVYEALLRKWG